MKKFRLLTLFMVLSMIFCFYGMSFAGGGGPEGEVCQYYFNQLPEPPAPDAGKFLRGEFTVANTGLNALAVHVRLKWGNQEQMYSFITAPVDLCTIDAESFKDTFAAFPCNLIDTAGDFDGLVKDPDLVGVPVITDLVITNEYFCPGSGIIRGEIVVRVVPLPPPLP